MKSILSGIIILLCANSVKAQIDTLLLCDPSDEVQLLASPGRSGYKWSPFVSLDNPTVQNPIASPVWNTLYVVEMIGDLIGDNLIANHDFEEGNLGFSSDYPYTDRIFTQGLYGVSTSAAQLNGIYFSDCPDHTSGEGMMMVVDGSPIGGQKVWCQTVEVNPQSTYAFSTWLTSVLGDNPAELQFSINDTRIGQIFSAQEEVCEWRQFYELWKSKDTSIANICIINKNEDRNGNDFALDDILFAETEGTLYDSTMVLIKDVSINPSLSVLPDCGESNGQLIVDPSGIKSQVSYSLDGSSFQNHPRFENIAAGQHDLSIMEYTSATSLYNSCIYDTTVVVGQKPCPVYIPNAFDRSSRENHLFIITPHPQFVGSFAYLNIIDKWGTQVFYSNDHHSIESGWDGTTYDGKKVLSGVYVYILEIEYPDGTSQRFTGDVTLF